jgi:hypothetical protein
MSDLSMVDWGTTVAGVVTGENPVRDFLPVVSNSILGLGIGVYRMHDPALGIARAQVLSPMNVQTIGWSVESVPLCPALS